jgi:hypothetical protein
LEEAELEAARKRKLFTALRKTNAFKLADMKAVLLASRRVRQARERVRIARQRLHDGKVKQIQEESDVNSKTKRLQSEKSELNGIKERLDVAMEHTDSSNTTYLRSVENLVIT